MAEIRRTPLSVQMVAKELAKTFSAVFHVEWTHASPESVMKW
jgi:hypothetical protein